MTSPAYRVVTIGAVEIRESAYDYLSGKMIDIGCGTKAKSILVGDFVDEHIGLDHDECPHDKSLVDLIGTCYDIPAQDQTFDSLLCNAVMEHIEDPAVALQEMYRVLKPGGYGVFTVPMFWHLHEEPRDFLRYTRFGLEYLFTNAGFSIVNIKPMSGFWTTFLTEFSYYIVMKCGRSIFRYPAKLMVAQNNFLAWLLDRGKLRDERFSWMHKAIVQRPKANGN
ncbi:MAG: hypothetical protein NPIRA06_00630 [Nitrospirales bacterium]|nr:MAG: hypothetical protein NPIRA06_00630 [Nitrospirales bacterium]